MMHPLLILVAVLAVPLSLIAGPIVHLTGTRLLGPVTPGNWPGVTKDVHAKHVFATGDIAEAICNNLALPPGPSRSVPGTSKIKGEGMTT